MDDSAVLEHDNFALNDWPLDIVSALDIVEALVESNLFDADMHFVERSSPDVPADNGNWFVEVAPDNNNH